jgi:agmatine/peptidylarginine deiminase
MRYMVIALLLIAVAVGAEKPTLEELEQMTREWMRENPHSLPHWLTPEEMTRLDEIGLRFTPTPPPPAPVRNVAEFEHMEGVLIRYPFGISYAIIAELSEDVMVTTIVTGQSQENTVRGYYAANGVNLANCNFLWAPSNSYWTRDYGPWYVVNGNLEMSIVDFPYNRPRPDDDEIPVEMASFLGTPLYGMDLEHTGGNYMTDGMGISASTDLVWYENPSMTHQEIADMVEDYLGVTTYHVVDDPNNTYIDHIDCWGKYLDVDKILIREVAPSHPQYSEIEATAAYFAMQISAYGTPYEVYRVYTPSDQPYTNSLILNNKVLVPITGSVWDDDALTSYEQAMPGYEVLGFTGSWASTDALHCRTKGVADRGMLYIEHLPLTGSQLPGAVGFDIQAEIIPLSGSLVIADSVFVRYRVSGGFYFAAGMTQQAGYTWQGAIPVYPPGTELEYYIHAADVSGRSANHPYIGAPDPHVFTAGGFASPTVSIRQEGSQIRLTWNAVPGASSYKVYSSDNPFSGFTLDLSGTFSDTSWAAPIVGDDRYYRVTATDE